MYQAVIREYQAVIRIIWRLYGLSGGYTGREKYQAVIREDHAVIWNFFEKPNDGWPLLGPAKTQLLH